MAPDYTGSKVESTPPRLTEKSTTRQILQQLGRRRRRYGGGARAWLVAEAGGTPESGERKRSREIASDGRNWRVSDIDSISTIF
jgi:hypothetical protein